MRQHLLQLLSFPGGNFPEFTAFQAFQPDRLDYNTVGTGTLGGKAKRCQQKREGRCLYKICHHL